MPKMRFFGLPLASLFLSVVAAQDDFDFSDCSKDADVEKCTQKIDTVVEVAPSTSYFTKIACKDCPYAETWNEDSDDGKPESRITHGDQELVSAALCQQSGGAFLRCKDAELTILCPQFFNITLADDTRSILVNGKKIFPTLNTIPNPPHISVQSLHPDFSYTNLTYATQCENPTCEVSKESRKISSGCTEWCQTLPLGRALVDYSYAAHIQKEEADAKIKYWEIVFDPVGGRNMPIAGASGVSVPWKFDDPDRKSVLIVVAGQPIKPGNRKPRPHNEDTGGLFEDGNLVSEEYEFSITSVSQVARRFEFETPALGFFGKIRRFFGGDVWKTEGELVYLSEEWGVWGKKGTLRNWVGEVFHSSFLGLFFIVIGSIVGGFLLLRIVHSLWLFAKQQSGLARWKGIDAVYSQLNQPEDEEGGEFRNDWTGDYRDSYEEGPSRASMGWHEERMKPLPTKPLPEKPLPQEPLIDT